MTDETITAVIIFGGAALAITFLIMRKRIMRFLSKVFGWEKRREFKDKPVEPKKPKDPIEEPELPPIENPEPPKEEPKVFIIELSEEGDQTASLQAQIDAIPDGTPEQPNIIQFPEGRFKTEGDPVYRHHGDDGIIAIRNRKNLIFRGNNTTFYTTKPAIPYGGNVGFNRYSYRRHVWINNCDNILVENIRIEGSNTIDGRVIGTTPELTPDFWYLTDYATAGNDGRDWKYLLDENGNKIVAPKDTGSIGGAPAYTSYWEQEHGFDVRNSENIVLDNCPVYGVWGDGVYVGGDTRVSRNIEIKNSHLKFTGRQGIAAANNVDGLIIDNVDIDLGRRASIDFEPHTATGYVRNAVVKNCKLHAVQVPIAAIGAGDVSNIQILNNEFSGGNFIACGDSLGKTIRKNWIVKGNTRTNWFGSPMASMIFMLTENILIEGNSDQISSKQGRNSISFDRCGGEIKVIGNDFKGGLYIQSKETENIVIENNTPEQTQVNV